jgi:hypothetical protein
MSSTAKGDPLYLPLKSERDQVSIIIMMIVVVVVVVVVMMMVIIVMVMTIVMVVCKPLPVFMQLGFEHVVYPLQLLAGDISFI